MWVNPLWERVTVQSIHSQIGSSSGHHWHGKLPLDGRFILGDREGSEGPLGTTCEITQPPPLEWLLARLEKFRLQSIARNVLGDEKVAVCLRRLRPGVGGVSIKKGAKQAYYSGLITCASVWNCPVCAAKISEGRRVELGEGMTRWKRAGGNVLHLVQTVPHYNHQPLRQVLEGFMAARRFQRNRKTWKRIAGDIELAGIVRGLETTYGENGWHVHSHELLYVKSDRFDKQDLGELESRVLPTWESACVSAGLGLPNSRGVVIQDGSYAAKYAAKWGLESEVTKGHIKRGRDGNSSPWDLLRGIAEGVTEYQGLFQEYARAFKGRHQLEWSRGLRKMLEMEEEESDADLAEEEEEGAELLGMLTFDQWRVVLRKDRRAELLGVAEREGWRGVLAYISGLVGMREPGQEG